ncbi:helix-hairpin-helix domain-containing protein [Curtobacterium luteum]|uniref:helix-hairpin-helix domain-containing protein n=1 Tax=Curtobacterium luteum TaxID=33881 RepID=UPI003830AF1C
MSSRFSLTPRAAVVLAAVVAVVAVLVIVLGTRSPGGGSAAEVVVSDAPSAEPSSTAGGATAVGSPTGTGPDASTATPSVVVVHVAGAVGRPGVVTLPAGSRVTTALERAGGAARDADLARVNLARPLVDGEQVYVPRVGETDVPIAVPDAGAGSADVPGTPGSTGADAVVDLNAADAATLETLPGIGPALAERILAWREEHGRFAAVEDLLDVSGIGDAKFADLQPRVRV